MRHSAAPSDGPLLRTAIEIDGRRVVLGLPAALWRGGPGARDAGERVAGGADDDSPAETADGDASRGSAGDVLAPVGGTLQAWKVADGVRVAAGEPVAVLEAMKMEMMVTAPSEGCLRWHVQPGATVAAGGAIGTIV